MQWGSRNSTNIVEDWSFVEKVSSKVMLQIMKLRFKRASRNQKPNKHNFKTTLVYSLSAIQDIL